MKSFTTWFERNGLIFILAGTLFAAWIGLAAREIRDTSFDRRIYFVENHRSSYIFARDYRGHWIIDDKLRIQIATGPTIEVEAYDLSGKETLRKIAELQSRGILPR